MAAEFPTSSKEFTTKQDGVDKIYASHVNDIQDEVMALEQALLGEILDGNVQYVKKAASSTDNAIPRFDGTDGKKLQNSGVTIDDSNNIKVGTAPVPTSVATSTDNAIPRFDGVDGKKLQNSGVTIDDTNNIMAGAVPVPTSVATSTDNAVVRFDGTGGNKIQNSGVTIDDSNNIKVGTAPVPTSVTSSTDNAVPRFDGTDGKKIQNSGVIINDSGQLSGNGLDGWVYDTDTWTYVSATSFKIAGKNVAYRFPKGTKIKLVQSGNTKYFYVVETAFSTDTTITITGGSDYSLANATISGQAYSYAAAPQNFPLGTSTFVPLTTPLTSTSWDGDARSTTSATKIDLSDVFDVPAGVKAIAVRLTARDSATFGTDGLYLNIGPNSTYSYAVNCIAFGGDVRNSVNGICPCNDDGDIYYRISASGTGTLDAWIEIWGYWL